MSIGTESVLLNALPLLVLAGLYVVVTAAIVPAVWRDRASAHPLDLALAMVFPAIAVAAAILGALVLHDRRPLGGHLWFALVAILIAIVPAAFFLALWGDRAAVVGRARRTREAEARALVRDRELEAVAAISNTLARAADPVAAARPLVRQVRELLGVEFAAVVLVDDAAEVATGVLGEVDGRDAPWWRELQLDLRNEPSGIASAVFDAAPVAVYDVQSSPLVSPRLASMVGAKSGVWVPMIAEERVVGVLVAAPTREKHAFTQDEIALLQALAGETALALDRMRSAEALSVALAREQLAADVARKVRGELDVGEVVRVAREEVRAALAADDVHVDVGGDALEGAPATLRVERAEPLTDAERRLVEIMSREVGAALQTARLLAENQRRLEQQGALLYAAQVVTSALELDTVLQRLVEEVTKLLRADAADCYLLDRGRGVLRCAAVHGLDPSLVGFEFTPDRGLAGPALREHRPVAADEYDKIGAAVPHRAYEGFSRALVAPMVWAGDTRGVLGVGIRGEGRLFDDADFDALEAFAGLASLALRNAESFAERTQQARVQRAFYRIASLLGEPLSLAETLDAAAQAASEALGGDFGAVVAAEGGPLNVIGAFGLPDEVRALTLPAALADAARDAHILASQSVAEDDRLGPEWRRAPFASLLAIPIEGEGPAAGLVLVFFRATRTFVDDDLELARRLASAARGALERSRLYEAERTARSLSQQLARTGTLLATELDPAAVLEEVVSQATALLGVEAGALAQLDGEELVVVAAVGTAADEAIGARSPSTGWLGGDVVQSRAPVAYEDAGADPSLTDSDAVLARGYHGYLGVPLTAGEGALHGVLSVYSLTPRVWREEEIEALTALAANASVALSNAELYQRVALEREQSVAILANIADGIVAVDRDGQVVAWNAAAEQITGVPATEAVGRTPAQVLQRTLESDAAVQTNRLVSIMRGGEEVWLSLSEAVMRDPAGAVAGRIFAFRDISAERVVEQMKTDFVSGVSHELRTPLTSIYGFAETLLRQDIEFGEEERRTFLGYIASESERLTRIVDALLNVARLDTGDLQVSLEPTDVGAVVTDVVSAAEAASADGHSFVVDVNGTELRAHADPDKLRQVVDRLVENAIKFSPDGGIVRIEARRGADKVEVTVADEGVGIPSSQRERIFSKFYRGGDEAPGGTGLGLFIAQGLVSAMGGRIWVDSEEGRGSRFTFELPAARAE